MRILYKSIIQIEKNKFFLERTFSGHSDTVKALIKINKNRLISAGKDDNIKVWEIDTGKCLKVLMGHSSYIHTLLKLNQTLFASGSSDFTIKIWCLLKWSCLNTL